MVGIIILNYNSAEDTKKCVASIEKYTSIAYKIYVVDGASTDDSYRILKEHFAGNKRVKLIKSEVNGGYSYGNNLGIKEAIKDKANTILIINPDVVLLNNAIDLMYNSLQQNSDVAVVGPRIFGPTNEDMQFAAKLLTFKNFILIRKPFAYFKIKRFYLTRFYSYDIEKDFTFQGMVSGCCFMIKTKDFQFVDLLDDNVFLFFEEDILSHKLSKIKKSTKIISKAKVCHNHSHSVSAEGNAFIRFHRFYSSEYVLKKYIGISNLQLFVVSLFHILPFAFNSIYRKSYRLKFLNFLKKSLHLYSIKKT